MKRDGMDDGGIKEEGKGKAKMGKRVGMVKEGENDEGAEGREKGYFFGGRRLTSSSCGGGEGEERS
jgi:hypothetical protein